MHYESSMTTLVIFLFFVAVVVGISFRLGAKAKSAQGFFAAGGGVPWWVNGIAFAGDYLSAASFLGICGMIAFYGYDGFLYSIGYLAGWIVALFVIAEPMKRLGRYTFADALDNMFNSRGIKLSAAISTLVVSVFYLIPQMVGAGALITPLLGWDHWIGVSAVGSVVIIIVATAGMVSTTWVQFIKGGLLVFLCSILTVMILNRGFDTNPGDEHTHRFETVAADELLARPGFSLVSAEGVWEKAPYVRTKNQEGTIQVWRITGDLLSETQTLSSVDGVAYKNGKPASVENDLHPIGTVAKLPNGQTKTGPLGPLEFFRVFQESEIILWKKDTVDGTTIFFQAPAKGSEILSVGGSPTFAKLRDDNSSGNLMAKIDFLSLMLALFCGTASLPHILIRYYTVKDQTSARKSTIMGIAAIGFFYVLTLYLGLGAMTSGSLDPTSSNMAAPLLAKSFGEILFAIICAVAFTTVLGTVSGLIMAASGAVAHDLMTNVLKIEVSDERKVHVAKLAAVVVGIIAIFLGIVFEKMNVNFLVGWAFNIAASANLPALVMLLFWKGTTKQGITAAIFTGMITSLGWILLSAQAFKDVYGLNPADAIVPFSQPAIVSIPLGFLVLVVVSLMTQRGNVRA
jgi:cation/acetate symporter